MSDNSLVTFSVGLMAVIIAIFIGVVSIFGLMAIYSKYNVWASGLRGQAELAQADYNRQIAVREAMAKYEASKSLAAAEIERAKGVAEANRIIGESLKNNEAYLRYLWIDSLDKTQGQVIYVPTEANLPILEASRKGAIVNKEAK